MEVVAVGVVGVVAVVVVVLTVVVVVWQPSSPGIQLVAPTQALPKASVGTFTL